MTDDVISDGVMKSADAVTARRASAWRAVDSAGPATITHLRDHRGRRHDYRLVLVGRNGSMIARRALPQIETPPPCRVSGAHGSRPIVL